MSLDTSGNALHPDPMSVDRYARVLELVDPSVDADTADWLPVLFPRRMCLDGIDLPDGVRLVDLDGGGEWPFTVTIAVPSAEVRYVVTKELPDGTAIGGRVWIGETEVYVPIDPISYPADPDVAYVDFYVAELRVGGVRNPLS